MRMTERGTGGDGRVSSSATQNMSEPVTPEPNNRNRSDTPTYRQRLVARPKSTWLSSRTAISRGRVARMVPTCAVGHRSSKRTKKAIA